MQVDKILNSHSFINKKNEKIYIFGSKILKPEDDSTEYKLFDLKKPKENSKKLEYCITGMLNKEVF